MEEVKFISYKGAQILRIQIPDGVDYDGVYKIIEEAKIILSKQLPESVLAMTIIGNVHFTPEITKYFEDYVKANKSYINKSAVLGVSGLKKVLYNAYMILSHRQVKICDTEEEAKEFLVKPDTQS